MKYEVINIRTIENEFGGLSFFEGEHDIPFAIKHLCCIYKTDEERKRTFYTDAASQLLMFCPYGEVEVAYSRNQLCLITQRSGFCCRMECGKSLIGEKKKVLYAWLYQNC